MGVPREAGADCRMTKKLHATVQPHRPQKESTEYRGKRVRYLYDNYEKEKGRVLAVHVKAVAARCWRDENDELIDPLKTPRRIAEFRADVLENLKTAGCNRRTRRPDHVYRLTLAARLLREAISSAEKIRADKSSRNGANLLAGVWTCNGRFGCCGGEAGEANFDVLIACAFNYEAHTRVQ